MCYCAKSFLWPYDGLDMSENDEEKSFQTRESYKSYSRHFVYKTLLEKVKEMLLDYISRFLKRK